MDRAYIFAGTSAPSLSFQAKHSRAARAVVYRHLRALAEQTGKKAAGFLKEIQPDGTVRDHGYHYVTRGACVDGSANRYHGASR